MKEIHINLIVTALTLVLVCGIGALAEGLSKDLDKAGNESFAAEYKMPGTGATTPVKHADADGETGPPSEKSAARNETAAAGEWQ